MAVSIQLTATIERKHPRLPRFVVVQVAKVARWAFEQTTVVEGALKGVDLGRRGLKRWDDQRWFLEIPEPLCRRAKVDSGARVTLTLRLASAQLPDELTELLRRDADANEVWKSLTTSQQRMLREHIGAARQSATRARRAAQALCRAAAEHG